MKRERSIPPTPTERPQRARRGSPRGRSWLALAALLLAGCMPPPPRALPAPPPPAPPPGPPPFTATEVWTTEPGVVLRGDSATVTLPWLFMRLAVLQVDSSELVVRCLGCRGAPTGRVPRDKVVAEVRPVAEAARLQLADFALAMRDAALRRDYDALRAGMARNFVSALDGPEGVLEALAAWQGRRTGDLQRLASLLDRGLASGGPGGTWAAPPEFFTTRGYNDLRAGFRRGQNGAWEMVFLVRPGI